MRDGVATTEYEIQSLMMEWFDDEGLVTDAPPIVAVAANAGDPHYQPAAEASRDITPGNVVLLDLWGKRPEPGSVFADISWMGFTGTAVPAPVTAAFDAARDARDAAVALIESAGAAGAWLGSGPRGAHGAGIGRVRQRHPAPHRAQPG
jgi:Xaa-Pro aminopeptidase